jgi:LPS export ABC transporter protein LptC
MLLRKVRFILLGMLVLLMLGCLLYFWLRPPTSLNIKITRSAAQPEQEGQEQTEPQAKQLTYNYVEDGVHKWGLVADSGSYDVKEDTIYLNKVKVIFYPEEGGELHLEADEGRYDQTRQMVWLNGNVKGRNDKDMTLRTESLTYAEDRRLVDTDAPVVVEGPSFTIKSIGMQFYLPTQEVRFKQRVDSVFIPQGESSSGQ